MVASELASRIVVGKCGSARYSSLSVRLAGNSGGTAEKVYFRPEVYPQGVSFLKGEHYGKRITEGL